MSATKLTTIVSIDVAGYSALAQSDEDAAIAAVTRLGERCAKAAMDHGGRIFNTAGDAVLMEFTSVSGGIRAAAEIAAYPQPPVRVGVHLGEVSELPNGDLLGHGVNVASRLQSHAKPSHVIVSEDARRALRGGLANRLVSRGVIKLDKIDESIGIYELTDQARGPAPVDVTQRALRNTRFLAIGAAALTALVAVAVLAWPLLARSPPVRVAVFSPSTANDAELQSLATGIADDITLALTAASVDVIARAETTSGTSEERLERARELGAALAVEGSTERNGPTTRVNIAIIRTGDRTTLWSNAFEGNSGQLRGLRQRAAEGSADVLACGVHVVQDRGADMDAETFALFLRTCATSRVQDAQLETRDTMAQVVAREPNFVYARALLALGNFLAVAEAPETMQAQLIEEARLNAERARRADPSIGESYIALAMLETNWESRERLLREGLDHDELNAHLNNFYSNEMYYTGRVDDALAFAQRAVALDPLSTSKRRNLAGLLVATNDIEGAREILDDMADAYPDDPVHWWARMRAAFWSGRYDDAISLLDAPASQVRSPASRLCWRQAADAMRGRVANDQGAQRALACYRNGDSPRVQSLMLLSALGDLDQAFLLARTIFVDETQGSPEILFHPATSAMRADPRFMPLMKDLGLLAYWRSSGRWPDFCREPGLPHRCEAEAERLL
ncbi:MAG: tetratricopeptide repeat protein [Hyphomonadaceae bacterium]